MLTMSFIVVGEFKKRLPQLNVIDKKQFRRFGFSSNNRINKSPCELKNCYCNK